MTHELSLSTAFLLGLLGSGHCIGMCGGLMAAMSLKSNSRLASGQLRHVATLIGYNAGRITSYTLIGFLMGWLGWFLGGFSREFSLALRVFSGLMLVAMGLYLAGWWMGLTRLERMGHTFWQHIQPKAITSLTVISPAKAVTVGFIWGWLPCGLVYSTLAWSASSTSAGQSALLMFVFGLGTLPTLVLTGLVAQRAQAFLQSRQIRSAAGILIIVFGIWTIPGPHQMWIMKVFSLGPH